MTHISSDGRFTKIDGLVTDDARVAQLLESEPEDQWASVVERALVVGAHGLTTMGLDVGLDTVRDQIRRDVEHASAQVEARIEAMLQSAEQALSEQLDPDQRNSLLARSLREFHQWRAEFLQGLDTDYAGSVTGRLLDRLRRSQCGHG